MASSRAKPLWDELSPEQKKEMAAIAAGRASPHASAALSCCAASNSAPLTTTRPQEPLSEFHRPTHNICNARDQKSKRVRPGV
uniref:Uncharacterized protein n=1 Tax=Aegilops tauschii TaxID=37682 RepID=N1QUI9_AEGTA